jgi:hypothetical protein
VGVEPRAYLIIGDVRIRCAAMTRGTTANGSELWDIVDSLQIVDPSGMGQQAWNSAS